MRDDELEGDDAELAALDGTDSETGDRAVGVEATDSLDDEFIEADLGDREEILVEEDDEAELEAIEFDDSDDGDDEYEILLLQEMGIDIDAPDDCDADLDLEVALVDDDSDDGVAA